MSEAQTAAASTAEHKPEHKPEHKTGHYRRKIVGKVIKDKMDKTVVVECINASRDPLYGKYVRTRKRFKAHDEKNEYKVGDQVEIQEHAPMSREKRFMVIRLVKKFVEE
jgi:small subunit ribosomal protein S17